VKAYTQKNIVLMLW